MRLLYEKVAFKSTSAESLPRWAIGTGQSSCLQFRSGTVARRGRGCIMPFGSASTTLSSLCPTGHVGYIKKQSHRELLQGTHAHFPEPCLGTCQPLLNGYKGLISQIRSGPGNVKPVGGGKLPGGKPGHGRLSL